MAARDDIRRIDTTAEVAVLMAREERLRLAMQAARVFFWDWDVVHDSIVWDEGLADALQMRMDEVPASSAGVKALIHPEDAERVGLAIEAALEGRSEYDLRFRMIRKDGSVRWTDTRAIVVRDSFGRPVRMVGSDRDVTDRVELEQEALEARHRLARIAEAARLAWFEVEDGEDGQHAELSEHCRALLGLAQSEALPADISSRIHPKDRPAYGSLRERLALWGGEFDDEFRIVLPSGVVRRVRSIGRAEGSPQGALRRVTGIYMDGTSRPVRDPLQDGGDQAGGSQPSSSPALSSAIAEAAWHLTRDAIQLLDEAGGVVDQNEAAEVRFGPLGRGDRVWADVFATESRTEADRALSRATDGMFTAFVASRPVAEGGERRFAIELSPLLDGRSRCIGILVRSRLLTEAQG
ncbi:PAS domain-containing protein [Nostoc sp. NIES-2111]